MNDSECFQDQNQVPALVVNGPTSGTRNITGTGNSVFLFYFFLSTNRAKDIKRKKASGNKLLPSWLSFSVKLNRKASTCSDRGEREQLVTSLLQQEQKRDWVQCGPDFEEH